MQAAHLQNKAVCSLHGRCWLSSCWRSIHGWDACCIMCLSMCLKASAPPQPPHKLDRPCAEMKPQDLCVVRMHSAFTTGFDPVSSCNIPISIQQVTWWMQACSSAVCLYSRQAAGTETLVPS